MPDERQPGGRPLSTTPTQADLGAEREVDLRRVWRAIAAQWWIVVAGVVAGAILGGLYSLSGGSTYEATASIAPGQAFNPGGNTPVLGYLTSKAAIDELATSDSTLQEAATKTGLTVQELRGNVTTSSGVEGTPAASTRLVGITVSSNKRKKAEDAANAIAEIVQRTTTSSYVKQSISIYTARINNYNARLKTLQQKINSLVGALKEPGLSLNESLLLTLQLDQAQGTQGQTLDSLLTAQQQRLLAEEVQQTQIVQEATAAKSTTRSRRNAIFVGAVIGLLGGLCAALVVDWRAKRPRPA